jgi:hypothetical protein
LAAVQRFIGEWQKALDMCNANLSLVLAVVEQCKDITQV